MEDCGMDEKVNGDYIMFTCRLEKEIMDKIEDYRATRRPIPPKMAVMRELLLLGLAKKGIK